MWGQRARGRGPGAAPLCQALVADLGKGADFWPPCPPPALGGCVDPQSSPQPLVLSGLQLRLCPPCPGARPASPRSLADGPRGTPSPRTPVLLVGGHFLHHCRPRRAPRARQSPEAQLAPLAAVWMCQEGQECILALGWSKPLCASVAYWKDQFVYSPSRSEMGRGRALIPRGLNPLCLKPSQPLEQV